MNRECNHAWLEIVRQRIDESCLGVTTDEPISERYKGRRDRAKALSVSDLARLEEAIDLRTPRHVSSEPGSLEERQVSSEPGSLEDPLKR